MQPIPKLTRQYFGERGKLSTFAHKHMIEMIKAKSMNPRPDEERFILRRIPRVES